MSADLVIRAPRAVVDGTQRPCALAIRDGRIEAVTDIDAALSAGREIRLADDEVLLPGLVDTHVHVNEPGRTEWEGFATATRAAAAGGVTTLIDMPLNCIPPTTTADALRTKLNCAAGNVWIDVGFWGGAVPGNLDDLADLHAAGVFGFKCFLIDSGVPEFPPLDAAGFDAAADRLGQLGALLIVHCEDAEVIAAAPGATGRDYAGFLGSRPHEAEDRAIDRVIAAGRRTDGRVHVLHLSSAAALGALRRAQADGVRVTAETCPHYLSLEAATIPDGATQYKCCPPVRDADNRDLLWAGLADGTIGTIASDHSPSTLELKTAGGGDFGQAWGGIASVQLGLPLVWTAARERGVSLTDVVRWLASAPARLVGLDRKGHIGVGADADLCVFAPDERFTVDPAALLYTNPTAAYAGWTLNGVVRATWLRGARVDLDGAPHGRLLVSGEGS